MQESSDFPTYLWQVPGKPVSVRLNVDLIDRLTAHVKEGLRPDSWRGVEMGGLLLGRSRSSRGGILVEVNDFEPIESEHAAGPSLMLSASDRLGLEARLAKPRGKLGVVGFYRSHTRRDFGIEIEDVTLFSNYFAKASNVFLLMKPRPSGPPTAGFLIWEDGRIRSGVPYLEFPFSKEKLENQGAVIRPVHKEPRQDSGRRMAPVWQSIAGSQTAAPSPKVIVSSPAAAPETSSAAGSETPVTPNPIGRPAATLGTSSTAGRLAPAPWTPNTATQSAERLMAPTPATQSTVSRQAAAVRSGASATQPKGGALDARNEGAAPAVATALAVVRDTMDRIVLPRRPADRRPAAPASTPRRTAVPSLLAWKWAAGAMVLAAVLATGILSRPTPPTQPPDLGLALKVAHEDGGALRLIWDRTAESVTRARRAVVWIQDGSEQAKIDLDSYHLREGSIAYVPKSGDVTFRMEVFTAGASGTESVRALGVPYPASAATAVPASTPSSEIAAAESPAASERTDGAAAAPSPAGAATSAPLASARQQASRRPGKGSAQRVAEAPASGRGKLAVAHPAMSLLPEPPSFDTAPNAVEDASLPGEYTKPFCRVSVVPVSRSRLARVFGKLLKHSEVAPPSPLRDPVPAVPPDVRRRISGPVVIEVRVLVGATGAVQDAELLSKGKDPALADLALFASRRSEFNPARSAGQDVPSEVVLRYHFGAESQ